MENERLKEQLAVEEVANNNERDDQQHTIFELERENERLKEALQSVIEADKTIYKHHEPRPDGRLPKENGGTIWMTPKQIAQGVLSPHIGG